MDEIVLEAMRKWPNVPEVYGWLMLDRRGDWLIRLSEGGEFDRITNRAQIGFIARNYDHDPSGRWFFQNGPQRVFVDLECTPWVLRLDASGSALETHTGKPVERIASASLDDHGALVLDADCGAGVLLDRDLAAMLEHIRQSGQPVSDDALERFLAGEAVELELHFADQRIPIARTTSAAVRDRFGFVPTPRHASA